MLEKYIIINKKPNKIINFYIISLLILPLILFIILFNIKITP